MTSTMVDAVLTSLAQSGLGKLTVGAAMATQEVYNAARLHDCQKLQALLKQGQADINFIHGQSSADGGKSSDFETALMVAVDEGCLACTQSLVQHKATVNWQSVYDGYTAFLVACYHGNMNIGKYLVTRCPTPMISDKCAQYKNIMRQQPVQNMWHSVVDSLAPV